MSEGRQIDGVHEMVVVEGPQARSFLDGLLSQDLAELDQVKPRRSFLLSPQGKLRALLWVTGVDERVELMTDVGVGKTVADDLRHYKIRIKATIADPVPVSTVVGPDLAYTFLPPASISPLPASPALPPSGGETGTAFLPPASEASVGGSTAAGGEGGGANLRILVWAEWNALRIEAGEPVMGVDVDESTIPQETGLVEDAVSFSKGCFLGQELVARLDSRNGRVNRHLRRVRLDALPELPAAVEEEGGTITSAAPDSEGAIGLGLLHRRIEPGDEIIAGGVRGLVL